MRLGAHQETPRPPSHETNTPTAIASSDFQFIKEWISVEGGSVPLAIGAITPMVRIMIPTVSPCFSTRKEGVQRRDAHDNQHEDGDRHGGVMTDKAERRQTQQDQQGGIKHVQRSLPK